MARAKRFVQNDNRNAYCYYRYSSTAQRDTSIEQQKIEAHRYCEARNIRIIKEFADRAKSGTRLDREQLQLMLNEVKRDKPAYLILWKTDRLSRDEIDASLIKAQLREYGVKIEYVAEAMPEDEATRILVEKIYEGLSAQYSINLAHNVTRGMKLHAEKAHYLGHKILGYTGEAMQQYKIDENSAVIVRKIFNDYVNGKTLKEIADELNTIGYKTVKGNNFTEKSLLHTLHNRSYIGEYKYLDIIIENGFPRIISDDLFAKAQEMLERNRHNGRGNAKKVNQLRGIDFWLTGKLYCGECGSQMSGVSGTSKTEKLYYYYACNNHKKKICKKKNVRKNDIEEIVTNVLKECLNDTSLKILIAEKVYDYYLREYASDENYEQSIIANIKHVDNTLANIMKAIEKGIFNETTQARMLELEEQKRLLKDELALEQNRKKYSLNMDRVLRYLDSFVGNFDDVEIRRQALDFLIEKIYVYDDRLVVNFYYSDDKREINFEEFKKYIENLNFIMSEIDGFGSSSSTASCPLRCANPNTVMCSDFLMNSGRNFG